jgi:hypothetical protein
MLRIIQQPVYGIRDALGIIVKCGPIRMMPTLLQNLAIYAGKKLISHLMPHGMVEIAILRLTSRADSKGNLSKFRTNHSTWLIKSVCYNAKRDTGLTGIKVVL